MPISRVSAAWDVYVFGIPLLALLFFGFFKLDEVFAGKKGGRTVVKRRPPPPMKHSAPELRLYEAAMLSDPDGRKWDEGRVRKG